VDKKASADIGV